MLHSWFIRTFLHGVYRANLKSGPTEHKLHNSGVLAPLEEGQVLLGLGSTSRQRNIIVMVCRRVLALVVHALLAVLAAGLCIHQGLVVCAALVVCAMPNDLGQTSDEQQLGHLQGQKSLIHINNKYYYIWEKIT